MSAKKSQFAALTDIPAGSTLDFVSTGQNFKILDTDFLAALGVTGTIVQEGPVIAVPVLDPQGSVNAIRNLTGGAGISITVDAENGINITATGSAVQEAVIREIVANSSQNIEDDYVSCQAQLSFTLLTVATANKPFIIKNELSSGVVTVIPFGGETIEGVSGNLTLNPGESLPIAPITGGWSKF